ncbi:hypothetical protein GVAV_001500 [Gurleya vavrai]
MTFDFNIDENFYEKNVSIINSSSLEAIAITKNVKLDDLNNNKINLISNLTKKFFTKVNIEFSKDKINPTILKKFSTNDIICLQIKDFSEIKYAIDLHPDLLTFDYTSFALRLRPGFIRDAINRGIFIEINLRDCLYDKRAEWLRNVNDLLRITKGRGIVLGSGACFGTEVKSSIDIFHFLISCGLSKQRAELVTEKNGISFLEKCAFKRFTFKAVIANNDKKGLLKEMFINSKF